MRETQAESEEWACLFV